MKERPILFSAPMVRALLNCTKSQTRRVVKLQKEPTTYPQTNGVQFVQIGGKQYWWNSQPDHPAHVTKACPYGQPGDRLWVRETWQGPLLESEEQEDEFRQSPDIYKKPGFCAYRATDTLDAIDADGRELGWRPSIHMPRWASRILLEITSVRVERLQDISEQDAVEEGIGSVRVSESDSRFIDYLGVGKMDEKEATCSSARASYATLWEQINGPGSWLANPWVWVVKFKRVHP